MAVPTPIIAPFLNLLSSGLQRVSNSVFQKFLRLRRIDAALRGEAQRNPLVKKAIDDWERVLGTYLGEYDEALDSFMQSLERSGLLEGITQSALLRRSIDNNKILFTSEFESYCPGHPKSPDELYDQLFTSFSITLREITKDPILSDLVTAHSEQINSRLDLIEQTLTTKTELKFANATERRDALLRLSRGLLQSYKEVRIETIRSGAKLVPLDKIYIPPNLSLKSLDRNQVRTLIRKHTDFDPAHSDPRVIAGFYDDLSTSVDSSITVSKFADFRRSFQRVVILGDPGGGKSTLCQKVCHDLTKNFHATIQSGLAIPKVPPQTQKLAIRVILRQYEQARIRSPQLSIFEYISKDLASSSNLKPEDIEALLRDLMGKGHAVLAFDGLDEILDTANRRTFVDLVQLFANQYPLCPVLVTSRVVGYEDAPLSGDYDVLALGQLDNDQVSSYVKKFLRAVAAKSAHDADIEARRFMEQTKDNAADLRRNPLLLGLMAFLFHAKGDVPGNRPEIYGDCATLMFDRWDKNRGISPDVPSDFERAELFSEIASRMFPNVELRAGVSREWLLRNVLDFFQELYMDKGRAVKSARSITEFLVGRAWVMSEVGDQVFAFTHQTFLEFYFARRLEGNLDTVGDLLKELHPRIVRSEWDVVAHLSLQLKVQSNLRKQDEALQFLTSRVGKYSTKKYDSAYRLFSARSLEYLNGSETHVTSLLRSLCDFDSSDNRLREKLSYVVKAVHASNHRKRLAKEEAISFIASLLLDKSTGIDDRIWRLVAPSTHHMRFGRGHAIIDFELASEIRAFSKAELVRRAEADPVAMVVAFQWFGHISASALRRFGIAPFGDSYIPDTPFLGYAWIGLGASGKYGDFFRASDVPTSRHSDLLRELANLPANLIPNTRKDDVSDIGIPPDVWISAFEENGGNKDLEIGLAIVLSLNSAFSLFDGNIVTRIGPGISQRRLKKFQRHFSSILNKATPEQRRKIETNLA